MPLVHILEMSDIIRRQNYYTASKNVWFTTRITLRTLL